MCVCVCVCVCCLLIFLHWWIHYTCVCLVSQSCPAVTPRTVAYQDPLSMGILQARILEWVVMPSSRGSFQPRDQTLVSHFVCGFFLPSEPPGNPWLSRGSEWLCGKLLGPITGDPTHDKVMRRRPETQGCSDYKGPSRLTPASIPHCSLTLLLLSLFVLLWTFVLPAESSPAPLSLNKDQHRTLINKSPGRWFPMKGPKMKIMFQVKTFLLALQLVWQMHTNAHDCSQHLNHKQHKEPDHKRPW